MSLAQGAEVAPREPEVGPLTHAPDVVYLCGLRATPFRVLLDLGETGRNQEIPRISPLMVHLERLIGPTSITPSLRALEEVWRAILKNYFYPSIRPANLGKDQIKTP